MEQKNYIIAFTEDAESALLDVEKKYKLEENPEDVIKKIIEKKPLKINIVADLSRKFFENDMQEKNFIDSLKKDLGVTEETAKNIFGDVVNKIIPFLIKASNEEIEKGAFQKIGDKKEAQSDNVKPIRLIKEEGNMQKIVKETKPATPTKIDTRIDKNKIKEKATKIEKPVKKEYIKKQTDAYREPIE